MRRVVKREHLIHGQRLDVRIFYPYMGVEPFVDGSNIRKKPDPIYCKATDDSRHAFLLKNRPLLDELREQLKQHQATVSLQTEGTIEITFIESCSTVKRRLQWTKDVEKLLEQFLSDRLVVHKVPWNNQKIPSINAEQLADLSLKDNTRLMQFVSGNNTEQDHIIITALKDHLDQALSELTDMLTTRTVNTPLNEAVYRSKPLNASRDPKVNNHRASLLLQSISPGKISSSSSDIPLPPPPVLPSPSNAIIDDSLENLRSYQMDLLNMRFVDLAKRAYNSLTIDIDRSSRRLHIRGSLDQVNICKNYFESILNTVTHKHYRIGKEMAVFLSNPDTGEFRTEYFFR